MKILSWVTNNRKSVISALIVTLYIKFGLLFTANLFFEAYHSLYVDVLYVGYQVFKFAGYYYDKSDNQNAIALTAGLFILAASLSVTALRRKSVSKRIANSK